MSHTETRASNSTPVSRPMGGLDGSAFGSNIYNPGAYGATTASEASTRYAVSPVPPKSLDEIASDAQLDLFSPRRSGRRRLIVLAAALLLGMLLGAFVFVRGSGGKGHEAASVATPQSTVLANEPTPSGERADRSRAVALNESAEPAVAPKTVPPRKSRRQPKPSRKEPARPARYRELREELRQGLRTVQIREAADAALALKELGIPLDWEAHRWAARALRFNGDLYEAQQLYLSFIEAFPNNRYRDRAALWADTLGERITLEKIEPEASLDANKEAPDPLSTSGDTNHEEGLQR